MTTSPAFQISSDGGSTWAAVGASLAGATALAYVSSGTYSIKVRFDTTAGMKTGLFAVLSADDVNLSALPTVTNAADKTATFSLTKTGGSWLVTSVCTDDQGTYTASLKIAVLNSRNLEEIAAGETTEASTAYGWLGTVNKGLRQAPGGSATQLQGYPVDTTAPTSGQGLWWDGAKYVPGKIMDTNVDAGAAIGGTKVDPNFGTQTVKAIGYAAPTAQAFRLSACVIDYATDADKTASSTEYNNFLLSLTTSTIMSGSKNLIMPLTVGGTWVVSNYTGITITVKGATGSGVAITNNSTSWVITDGTDFTKMVPA